MDECWVLIKIKTLIWFLMKGKFQCDNCQSDECHTRFLIDGNSHNDNRQLDESHTRGLMDGKFSEW